MVGQGRAPRLAGRQESRRLPDQDDPAAVVAGNALIAFPLPMSGYRAAERRANRTTTLKGNG
ncbi:hypothetical protein BVI2075_480027 [Burkholderia vietnamiensis]|nr:hypothetical protein BVI2075_480027 [Burkholderia vietnamiensis]